jgi:hypothetical protein
MQIAIPLFDKITVLDAVGPYEILSRVPGYEVIFVGAERRARSAVSSSTTITFVTRSPGCTSTWLGSITAKSASILRGPNRDPRGRDSGQREARRGTRNPRLSGSPMKPSSGLEPETPSLPWKCSTN